VISSQAGPARAPRAPVWCPTRISRTCRWRSALSEPLLQEVDAKVVPLKQNPRSEMLVTNTSGGWQDVADRHASRLGSILEPRLSHSSAAARVETTPRQGSCGRRASRHRESAPSRARPRVLPTPIESVTSLEAAVPDSGTAGSSAVTRTRHCAADARRAQVPRGSRRTGCTRSRSLPSEMVGPKYLIVFLSRSCSW